MGQSFGSGAVLHAINSPLAKGLFHGAIAESGIKSPYDPDLSDFGSNYITLETAYTACEEYIAALNVSTVAELRTLSATTLDSLTSYVSNSRDFDPVRRCSSCKSLVRQSLILSVFTTGFGLLCDSIDV